MERVEFENDRGLTLVGDFLEADSDAGIVMAHGFKGNKDQFGKFAEVAEHLNSKGFNVFKFDFAGCGDSDQEKITVDRQVDDLELAIQIMKDKGVNTIGVLGLSMGGLVSLKVASDREDIEAMVLIAPLSDGLPDYRERFDDDKIERMKEEGFFVITRDEPENHYLIPKQLIETKENLKQKELLEGVESPVLFIHGTQDTSVPIKFSENAVQKLEDSALKKIDDDHYWNESVKEVSEVAEDWFQEKMPS